MKIVNRFGLPAVVFTVCVGLWLLSSLWVENWQASVGPDFLARIPVKIAVLAVIVGSIRWVVRFAFPSIFAFTNTDGGNKKSEFSVLWKTNPTDPRIWISVITYLLVFIGLSQAFLSS